jgi:hypothetical protein
MATKTGLATYGRLLLLLVLFLLLVFLAVLLLGFIFLLAHRILLKAAR